MPRVKRRDDFQLCFSNINDAKVERHIERMFLLRKRFSALARFTHEGPTLFQVTEKSTRQEWWKVSGDDKATRTKQERVDT